MLKRAGFLVIWAAATTGCLQKDATHTLYLTPTGGVSWVAVEANVCSDESEPGKRAAEEQAYIGPALLGSHPVARGLQALEPASLVRTTVVRDERPFHVITEASFTRVDSMLQRLLTESGLPTRVALSEESDRTRLRIVFDFSRTVYERDTPARALLEDLEHFVFVLQEGSFIAGGGFEVPDRGRARLTKEAFDAIDAAMTERRAIELTLAWSGA